MIQPDFRGNLLEDLLHKGIPRNGHSNEYCNDIFGATRNERHRPVIISTSIAKLANFSSPLYFKQIAVVAAVVAFVPLNLFLGEGKQQQQQ